MGKRRQRREAIDSFRVNNISLPPATRFIPVDPIRRRKFYRKTNGLPDYSCFKRRNLDPQDLYVLAGLKWWIDFNYLGVRYKLVVRTKAPTDGASVPDFIQRRRLTKRGQAIEEPAELHDCAFALHLFSFEDCNNLFEAMIEWVGLLNKPTKALYMLGVRSPVGKKIYEESDPNKHWLKDYVELYKSDDLDRKPTTKIFPKE